MENQQSENSGTGDTNPLAQTKLDQPIAAPLSNTAINVLGTFIVLFAILDGYLIYALWPQVIQTDPTKWAESTYFFCGGDCKPGLTLKCMCLSLSTDQRMILLVLLAGALGSFVHAATSFSNFVGENKIEKTWIWWYVLRPFVGMGVAFIFYLIFRGGLLTDATAESLNPYGVLTVAALSGLFTDRATLKLQETFQALFKPKDDRSGKLTETN